MGYATNRFLSVLCAFLFVLLAILPTQGRADLMLQDYGFYKITNNGNVDVGSQLTVEVWDTGTSGEVRFEFLNAAGGVASSITDIYFDDGTLLGISAVLNGTGTAFAAPATPSNLPGSNNATPAFETTAGFSADSDSPIMVKGVNPGESVGICFNLLSGMDPADVLTALGDGTLRIGLHVQSIGSTGGSDSYVNIIPVIPVPAAVLLGMLGLGVAGMKLRRFA